MVTNYWNKILENQNGLHTASREELTSDGNWGIMHFNNYWDKKNADTEAKKAGRFGAEYMRKVMTISISWKKYVVKSSSKPKEEEGL